MPFIIAQKIGMTRRFRDDGAVVPITVLRAGPCTVTQVKTADRDGYAAVQLGYGTRRTVAKPQAKAWGANFRVTHEFRAPHGEGLARGATVDVTTFTPGMSLRVTGTSKGKGFQGVVKRHGFAGGPASHGHKDNLRMPGSIGATFPQHVMKGTRMAGRMGHAQVSVAGLEVVDIDAAQHLLLVSGAIPGPRNGLIFLQTTS